MGAVGLYLASVPGGGSEEIIKRREWIAPFCYQTLGMKKCSFSPLDLSRTGGCHQAVIW